jgi:hypothetical protein
MGRAFETYKDIYDLPIVKFFDNYYGKCYGIVTVKDFVGDLEAVTTSYMHFPTKGAWINVNDKPPKIGQTVLVYTPNYTPSIQVDTWNEQRECPVSFSTATIPIGPGWDSGLEFDEVTHWMELPSAPQL